MNCQAGDIARIVAPAHFELGGTLVEVLRLAVKGADYRTGEGPAWWCRSLGGPIATEMLTGAILARRERAFADVVLRPIRDSDGEDETLRIAGKPCGQNEKVGA